LELASLVEDLREKLRPLRARLFPRLVLIELQDQGLRGQVLADGGPGSIRFDAPLPPLTCRDGMPLEKEPIGDLIGDLIVRDNLMGALVMAALPPQAVQWRVIEWSAGQTLPEDPLQAVRELDAAELRLPFPLQDAVIDLQPLTGSVARAVVAASPRPLVDAWIEVFNHAGVQLERLAPAQSCEFLGLRCHLDALASRDLVVLLSPSLGGTRLLLVRDGIPRYHRILPAPGDRLVEEVARSLAFYRRTDPEVRGLRLLQSAPLPEAEAVAAQLGVSLETLSSTPFDSLVIEGLATAEPAA
jgi:Tfp pilus assembly PilM family ATPase